MAVVVIWLGQIVSVLASGMAGFGLSLWMYGQTQSATAMGLMHVSFITQPVAPIIGGVLADYVLEPAWQSEGLLPRTLGWLVGTGPGSGMGLLIVFCGLLMAGVGVVGYAIPALRNAEDLLPDHDQAPAEAPAP